MANKIIKEENLELIAVRMPPGDRWQLIEGSEKIYKNLTDTLEAWFQIKGEAVSFRLDPLDSKLYAIRINEVEIKPEAPKKFSIYGEFSQKNE